MLTMYTGPEVAPLPPLSAAPESLSVNDTGEKPFVDALVTGASE